MLTGKSIFTTPLLWLFNIFVAGVFGIGRTRGVLGDSFSTRQGVGDGVQGRSNVQGRNGVFGHHFGAGVGVRALCNAGFGVFGESTSSVGVGGDSGSSNGVQGRTLGTGWAGAFFGRTGVVGDLQSLGISPSQERSRWPCRTQTLVSAPVRARKSGELVRGLRKRGNRRRSCARGTRSRLRRSGAAR
jgi:hypothetical protein